MCGLTRNCDVWRVSTAYNWEKTNHCTQVLKRFDQGYFRARDVRRSKNRLVKNFHNIGE